MAQCLPLHRYVYAKCDSDGKFEECKCFQNNKNQGDGYEYCFSNADGPATQF